MYLELVLTIAVGTVLTGVLLVCYIYVFRQLCCPPPRRRRTTKRNGIMMHQPAPQLHVEINGVVIEDGDRKLSKESLPLNLTGNSSLPTETEKI